MAAADPTAPEAELVALRAERAVLRSLLQNAPDFIAHITPEGRFLYLNRVVPGLEPAEVLRKTIYDFTDPRFHQAMRQALAQAMSSREQTDYESIGEGAHRKPTSYFTRVAPVVVDDQVTSAVLIATDVTRLKQAEAALRESEEMLLFALSSTGMGTWSWDRDRDVGTVDAVAAGIFGVEVGGAANLLTVMSQLHHDDRARVTAAIGQAFVAGQYGPIEHRIVRRDGSTRHVSASGRVLTDHLGRTRLVGGVVDVTDRRRLEEQLAQSQKMESVGRLAGGIAHDFNNMLTAILSYTELASMALPVGSSARDDLTEVRRAAERSAVLTAQLLAFARQQVIEPKVVDPNRLVLHVDKLLRRVLGDDIEVASILSATGHIRVDRNQFEQVLVNLATNAREAMPNGGRLTIETADLELDESYALTHPDFRPGWYVVFSVTDTGEGIAPQHLPRIFEPFFTTRPQGKGTGLGLATCYGVVTQNDGHILVSSELGHGASFKIYLPLVRAEPAELEAPAASLTRGRGGTETLLIVEDEPTIRMLVGRTLREQGYQVLEAANGVEALAVAGAHQADIALMVTDVVMPQLGGRQLAEQLSRVRPTMQVLFVSGYPSDLELQSGVLESGIEFLQKPFMPSALAERVRQLLDQRAAGRAGS